MSEIKDEEGWQILVGSYVRVERGALLPWRGWVTEIDETAQTVRIRDRDGRHRAARIGECHVTLPTRAARARRTMAEAASVKPGGNPRKRKGF